MKIFSNIDSFLKKKEDNSDVVGVFVNKTLFPFQYSFNESDKIVIFLPGAFNRQYSMPKFQRSGYFDDLEYNCISFFDPSLFLTGDFGFTRAWFLGTQEHSYVDLLYQIIKQILSSQRIDSRNVLFFSTSAGGIPAIKLASRFSGSHAYCGNIQTNLLNHYPAYVKKLCMVCFEQELEEAKSSFLDRMSVWDDDADFNLHISQNTADSFHLENHFLPYFSCLKSASRIKFEAMKYTDEKIGHNPLHKNLEIKIIKSIFEKGSFKDCFGRYTTEYLVNY